MQSFEALRTTCCHVNLITVPEELIRCVAYGKTSLSIGLLIVRKLVDAGDEFGFKEEERVIRAYADLVCLADSPAVSSCTSIHLLIDTEVGDLFVLVVRLDQT